jgi:hypothetical protein
MTIRLSAYLVALLIGFASSPIKAGATADETKAAQAKEAQETIWAKELAIYAGRAKGDLTPYTSNTSQDYLGWPPTAKHPMDNSALKADGRKMVGENKEKITTAFEGFTLHGDTAVIYYLNHRTMKPDGSPVDESFENIHVWVRDGADWKVLGAMSRHAPAAAPAAQ